MNHVGPYPPMTPELEKLARTFSSETVTEKVADLMLERDHALRELYLNCGITETHRITGWSKPTIMLAVRKAAGKRGR